MALRPSAATAVSTAGMEAATAGQSAGQSASEEESMSPEAVVASLQATIAALESAGPDAMSNPEVQAVLTEAGNIIAEMEAQDSPKQQAEPVPEMAGSARAGMQDTDLETPMQDSMPARQESRQHKHAARLQAASRQSRHSPAGEAVGAWTKVQAEPMQEELASAQDTMHAAAGLEVQPQASAKASAVAETQQKVSTQAMREPEDSEEVKQVLAELEALVSTAEAAAGITHRA